MSNITDYVSSVKLAFTNSCPASYGYGSGHNTFYFIGSGSDGQPNTNKSSSGFSFSRSINKNLITTTIPVSTYTGGSIAIDIGMSTDKFDLTYTTYSYDDYRYLGILAKTNNELRCGTLTFNVVSNGSSRIDTYAVALENIQFNTKAGNGFGCEIKLSLIIVDPDLSTTMSTNNGVISS